MARTKHVANKNMRKSLPGKIYGGKMKAPVDPQVGLKSTPMRAKSPKAKIRFRPGTVALREVRKY